MLDLENINVAFDQPGVAVATLHRPARLNALTFDMFQQLADLAHWADTSPQVRALVLTGAGRAFCAGLDLDAAASLPDMEAAEMLRQQEGWGNAITAFVQINTPVIAAINGAAAGAGFALALAADVRVGAPEARFNAAFVRIGLSGGDCGTSWTLPRVVGLGIANELLLTGRFVEAEEAERIGLLNRVVPADELLEEAIRIAQMISSNSPFGTRLTKAVIRQNIDAPSLPAALEVENRNQVLATRSADMVEALNAFREKRVPVFAGSSTNGATR